MAVDDSHSTGAPVSLLLNVSGEVVDDEERMAYVVTEKGSVKFTCSFQADPTPSVTWLKDDVPFSTNQPQYTVEKETTSLGNIDMFAENLIITSAVRADSGNYTCMVNNIHGVVSAFEALVVIGEYSTSSTCMHG